MKLACRIMDCFLADGIETIFRLALSLLLLGKNELLVQDMEGVIRVKMNIFIAAADTAAFVCRFVRHYTGKKKYLDDCCFSYEMQIFSRGMG